MNELLKSRMKLKKIQEEISILNFEHDELEEEIEDLEYELKQVNRKIQSKRDEEKKLSILINRLINNKFKENIKSYEEDSFEEKICKATLFSTKDTDKQEFSNIYIEKNYIYAIDGYRAIKCKHDENIEGTYIEIGSILENGIDKSNFKTQDKNINSIKESLPVKIEKIIAKVMDKENNLILNIDSDYLMENFLYKMKNDGYYDLYIFKFDEIKIAIQKKFIDDLTYVFENKKFSISYSGKSKPVIFEDEEITVMILPVVMNNINEI